MPESRPKPLKKLPSKAKGKKKEGKLTAPKRKLNLSPEQRKARSDAAKKKIAEGKLGGAENGAKGGRPRKKRASQVVAEQAQENGAKIAKVFLDGMDDDNPHSIRMKAASEMIKIENNEAKLQIDEAEQMRKMDHNALVTQVAEQFAGNPVVMNIFRQAGEAAADLPAGPETDENGDKVVDAEVVA